VNRFLIPGIAFLLLALVLYVGVERAPNRSTQQSALLGKPAPDFDLPSLTDPASRVSLAQLKGRPWVLNVWGTWCVGCREEHGVLLDIARQNAVTLVGLNWKDEDAAATAWLADLGNPYAAIAVDRDGRTLEVWQREFLSRLPRRAMP
jgi:cytochrome c biogenesis protein CcmG, thiol:disulfide interchange protein DsbE